MFHEDHKSNGITVSPKASFIVGLVGGVLVLCTIGFFVLLGIMLKGGFSVPSARVADDSAADIQVPPADDGGSGEAVGEVKPVSADDHVRGAKNAAVTLIEYSDFQCPFCDKFHPTMQQLMREYDGKVKWVLRHYPLSFHPQAVPSANASECAGEQGKFWEYADKLFENQATLGDDLYKKLAGDLGLNKSKFESCYSAKKYQAHITADQAGGTAAGVTGTPGTIILGADGSKQLVPGAVPYEQLKAMVDSAL